MAPSGSGSLLRHADFRRLWAGDTASQLGYALGSLAIPYAAVTTLAATQFQMGLLTALGGLGFLIIGLPAGAIVDRHSKRSVMILADLGRAALLGTLPLAWWLGFLTLAQLMVVATAVGVLSVFFDVSYQSYLPLLVHRDQVVDGNGKLQASQSVSLAAGPAIGGLLLTRVGAALVIGINAVGYLVSALMVFRIRHREPPHEIVQGRTLTGDIREGLSFVLRHRLLRRLIACTGIGNLAGSVTGALAVLYMVRDVHFSALTIGIVESSIAAGGLLGAVLAAPITRRFGEGRTVTLTAAAMYVLGFCYPLSWLLPAAPTLIVGGAAMSAAIVAYNIATVSFRQRLCPPALLGRMNASARFLVWGTIPIGGFLGGGLGTAIGVVPTLWVAAGIGLAGVVPVLTPGLWRLRRLPEHQDESAADVDSEAVAVAGDDASQPIAPVAAGPARPSESEAR
jgi:MFS family permease